MNFEVLKDNQNDLDNKVKKNYEIRYLDLTSPLESDVFNPNQFSNDAKNYLYLGNDETVKKEFDKALDESATIATDEKPNFKITDIIPEWTPFSVEGLNNRKFMFNDLGIREEEKMPDYWVKCDCEWELSYILMNLDKVHFEE